MKARQHFSRAAGRCLVSKTGLGEFESPHGCHRSLITENSVDERHWYNDCAVGFQPAETGLTPVCRSNFSLRPRDEGFALRTRNRQARLLHGAPIFKRAWCKGCAVGCQSIEDGSSPFARSISQRSRKVISATIS